MKLLILVAAIVVASSTAHAQDIPTMAFASAATADWISTHQSVKYFREANPIISWLDHKPNTMIALGVGIDVASVYAWHRVTSNHRKLRMVGLYAATAARVFIAARNIHIVRNRQRIAAGQ